MKLIRNGVLLEKLGAHDAARLYAVQPARYQIIMRAGQVRKLIDLLPEMALPNLPWRACYRTTQAAVLPPTPEWLRSVGYVA